MIICEVCETYYLEQQEDSEIKSQISEFVFFKRALRSSKSHEGSQFYPVSPLANESSKKTMQDKLTNVEISNIHLISSYAVPRNRQNQLLGP